VKSERKRTENDQILGSIENEDKKKKTLRTKTKRSELRIAKTHHTFGERSSGERPREVNRELRPETQELTYP